MFRNSATKFSIVALAILVGENAPTSAFTAAAAVATLRQPILKSRPATGPRVDPGSNTARKAFMSDDSLGRKQRTTPTEVIVKSLSRIRYPLAGILLVLVAKVLRFNLLVDNMILKYKVSMVAHPMQTKMITGGVLAVLGDALAQSREADKTYDIRRASSFAAFDMCYRMFQHFTFPFITLRCGGKVLGFFFGIMASLVGASTSAGAGLMNAMAATERTLAYQLVCIPLIYYPIFFTFTGLMQGLTIRETFERAKVNFLPCWKRNLMFWIPTQFVMFGFIDEKWQVPFVCVMGILWSLILSVTTGSAKKAEKA